MDRTQKIPVQEQKKIQKRAKKNAKPKMKKQMSYADTKQIPFVAMVGESEIANGTVALKNMATGEQCQLTVDQLIERLK